MVDVQELVEIWTQEIGDGYTVDNNAQRIFITQDGNGFSGRYDRIHVVRGDLILIFPAHQVLGWVLKTKKST